MCWSYLGIFIAIDRGSSWSSLASMKASDLSHSSPTTPPIPPDVRYSETLYSKGPVFSMGGRDYLNLQSRYFRSSNAPWKDNYPQPQTPKCVYIWLYIYISIYMYVHADMHPSENPKPSTKNSVKARLLTKPQRAYGLCPGTALLKASKLLANLQTIPPVLNPPQT